MNRQAWPLIVLTGILPWIIYFTTEKISFSGLPWFPQREVWTDIFLNGKSIIITLLGIWMACSLLYRRLRGRLLKPGKVWFWLLMLGWVEVVSTMKSCYPEYSLFGMIEQYEPIGVLLAYLMIARYAYEYVRSDGKLKPVIGSLLLSTGVICAIGLTQLVQHDLWKTDIGKNILIPEVYAQFRDGLCFQITKEGRQLVYTTLYNADYAGIFLAMLSPVLWLWNTKNSRILAVVAGVCLLGTGSGTAWVTAGAILLLGYFMKEKPAGVRKYMLPGICGCLLLFSAVWWNAAGDGNGIRQLIPLEEVYAGTDAVYLTYKGKSIRLTYTVDEETGGVVQDISYMDGTKVPVVWADDRGECDPKEQELKGLHFKVYRKNEVSYVQFRCNDVIFRFTDSLGTGKYEYVTINGKVDELADAATVSLFSDSFLNGRGYIWNRVIPLLIKHPMLGSGPDTFFLIFPQNDYIAKAKLGSEFFQTLITNAHNLYFQMAIQTGILSVLCQLLFVGSYAVRSLMLYWRRKLETVEESMGLAMFFAVSAYLISGLTWSSSVCTTPFFWLFLGMGTAINEKISVHACREK